MAITGTLLIHAVILSLSVFYLNAKTIKECDGVEKNYIENPSNCSEFIYCDGANSIYCSGDCSEEIDCDAQGSTATLPITNATTTATTTSQLTTTTSATTVTTKAANQTAESTTRPPVKTTATVSSLPTTLSVGTTTKSSSVSTSAASITPSSVRQLCKKGSFEKYPFPANCNYYYDCLDGFLMLQQCPFGMDWNVQTKKCMTPKKAQCHSEGNE